MSLWLTAGLVACGPKAATEGTVPKDGDPKVVDGQDQDLAYDAIDLPGTYFVPDGLDRPGMLLVRPTKKLTLDKQRAAFKKAKPENKVGEAEILASMLYETAQKQTDGKAELAIIEEARKILADTRAALPDKLDVILLHNLACLSFDVGDLAGAADALDAAIKLAPDDAGAGERRAYLTYYLLRANKNAEALAVIGGVTPSKDAPEQAYALAWAKWRAGDLLAARAALDASTAGWRSKAYVQSLKRDVLIFAARTGATVDEAQAMATAYAGHVKGAPHLQGLPNATFETLAFMEQAYKFAGRFTEASALIDRMFQIKEPEKSQAVKLRLEQADAAKKVGDAEGTVNRVKQALDGLAACGAACGDKDTEEAAKLVFGLARFANYLYTTSQDERWYTAAGALYASYLGIPGIADAATVKPEADALEQNHKNAAKNAGKHDKDAIRFVLDPYAVQVLACYDRVLQTAPTLAGTLTVKLEVSVAGEVTGATAEPAPGEQGVAAVAGCAVEQARGWVFPARTRPGITRISAAYTLQPPAPK